MSHRASYWKTTAIALGLAAICLAGLVLDSWLNLPTTAVVVVGVLLAAGLTACSLVASGGLVCLWRDAREAAGKDDPLARYATWHPAPPSLLVKRGLRFLQGPRLRPGDLVQVRSRHEIERTLDGRKALAGLPFMVEMEPFCGNVFQVHRRVDHINDMRNKTGLRRTRDVVTLKDVRCSGHAHGGCQAECQILWKDVWLKRLPDRPRLFSTPQPSGSTTATGQEDGDVGGQTYFCQMTALWEASAPLSPIDFKMHFQPLFCGNITIASFLIAVLTRIFNFAQRLRGGSDYPHMPKYPANDLLPSTDLHLRAGEAVVVRSKDEIAHTLFKGRNKGLWFDRDMVRFCGHSAIVRKQVNRIIHESTGKMVEMKTPCVMLEGVIATGEFLRLCPQHEYIFWREAWLTRSARNQRVPLASDH